MEPDKAPKPPPKFFISNETDINKEQSIVELRAALNYAINQYRLLAKSNDCSNDKETIVWFNIIHILRIRIEEKIKHIVELKE